MSVGRNKNDLGRQPFEDHCGDVDLKERAPAIRMRSQALKPSVAAALGNRTILPRVLSAHAPIVLGGRVENLAP